MRKPGLLFLLLLLVSLPMSGSDIDLSLTTDLSELDSFFTSGKRVSASVGVRRGQIGLEVPLAYGFSMEEEIGVVDIALSLRLYPLHDLGLYFATDVFSWIHIFGADSPDESDAFPSSFTIGYTFHHGYLLVEPELVFQNPLRLESQTFSFLSERYLSYMDFYFALKLGVDFTI